MVIWFQVFIFNINNLHIVVWFLLFLSNIRNFYTAISFHVFVSNIDIFQTDLFDCWGVAGTPHRMDWSEDNFEWCSL